MKRFLRFKYLLLLIAVVFLLIKYKDYSSPVSINLFKFERFLNDDEVERVLVINKSLAQVTIKDDALQTSKHKSARSTDFLGRSNAKGPHYQFEVGNLLIFQTKLEEAKSNGIEFDYDFKTVEGISIGFSSPFQLIIIILTVVGLFAILNGFSYKDFSEKLNGTLSQNKNKPDNKKGDNIDVVRGIVFAFILIAITFLLTDYSDNPINSSQGSNPECDLDGCVREGIGWTNVPPSTSLCKGIPCRPMGAKKGEGYCSKEHANRAIWKNY